MLQYDSELFSKALKFYVTEASSLGIPPGKSPPKIIRISDLPHLFTLKQYVGGAWEYAAGDEEYLLTIIND